MTPQAFKAALEQMNMSPLEAAQELGMSLATIYRYSTGSRPIPKPTVFALDNVRKLRNYGEPPALLPRRKVLDAHIAVLQTSSAPKKAAKSQTTAAPAQEVALTNPTAEALGRIMEQITELRDGIKGIAAEVSKALSESETRVASLLAAYAPLPAKTLPLGEASVTESGAAVSEKRQPGRPRKARATGEPSAGVA